MDRILIILGPTAIGKSDLAVRMALKFNGEVVSADSRQVYRGMDIGSGKITPKEMRGVPHHLLDVADPRENFSAARYQELARIAIDDIQNRGKLPILCGGTGQYIKALVNQDNFPAVSPNYGRREELEARDTEDLFDDLKRLDPRRAGEIDCHNRRRLIRAIEIAEAIGNVPELAEVKPQSIGTKIIGLTADAPVLRQKIHDRLIKRLNSGRSNLEEEGRRLHASGVSWARLESFGLEYKYLALYLQKRLTREQMIVKLESEIWHYAKRQMTWFKKFFPAANWFDIADGQMNSKISSLVNEMLQYCGLRNEQKYNFSQGIALRRRGNFRIF